MNKQAAPKKEPKQPTEKPKRRDRQKWPFVTKVTYASGAIGYMVDARTKAEGKLSGERKTFPTVMEAETYAQQCRTRRANEGNAAFASADLARFGKTVQDAIAFYLAHLRTEERSIPLADAIKELVSARAAAGLSQRYCYDLKMRLSRFEKAYPERSVASFSAKELDEWLTALKVAPGTQNTFRRDLQTLFSFCEKRGYCPKNEAKKTHRAKDVDKPASIVTVNQAIALLNACGDDTLPVVAISLFAGLRASEAQKLEWSEVDLESGHIEVTAAKAKTGSRRTVPISDNLAAWLRPLAKQQGPVAPLSLRKRLSAVKERAGFDEWPVNALRHTYGSYRLAQCQDVARTSYEMGNSPTMVFRHYRNLVRAKEMERFWSIKPATDSKVIAISAA